MTLDERRPPGGKRVPESRVRELTRTEFLKVLGAGGALMAGGTLLGACGGGGGGGKRGGDGGGDPYGGSSGGGEAEIHVAFPYQMPPTGHFNTFATNAITLGIYWDLMEMPLAIYRWADDEYIPLLGSEWGYEPPDVYRVTLREGAKWSDGSDFTAQDLITTFTLLRLQDNVMWNYLGSMEADGDYGVVFTMKDPSTVVERYVLRERIRANSVYGEWAKRAQDLFDRGVDSDAKVFRELRTEFEEFRPEEMVVSGPFKPNRDSMTESQMTLDKVKSAYHADDVAFDKIVNYNGETPAVTPLVLSKDIDYATHGFPIASERAFQDNGFRILRPPVHTGPALYFNYEKIKAVADPRVRRAIAMAIDKDENATVALGESAKKPKYMTGVADSIIESWVSQEDLDQMDPYEFDPEKAAGMLEDLGFEKQNDVWVSPDGERMDYELGVPAEFADWSASAQNLGEQLTRWGWKTTVRTVTFTQWSTRVQNGQFQMGIQNWGQGNPHPHFGYVADLFTYNTPQASGPGMDYPLKQETESVGRVDLEKLVIQSASGLDEEEQKEVITRLAKAFNELLPIIPIFERYGNNPALPGVRVTGWLPDGDPIYQNNPYLDSFVVIMMLDGTLKAAGQ
jgi:peptide/nickel transport system substrate-binding protein